MALRRISHQHFSICRGDAMRAPPRGGLKGRDIRQPGAKRSDAPGLGRRVFSRSLNGIHKNLHRASMTRVCHVQRSNIANRPRDENWERVCCIPMSLSNPYRIHSGEDSRTRGDATLCPGLSYVSAPWAESASPSQTPFEPSPNQFPRTRQNLLREKYGLITPFHQCRLSKVLRRLV
jgi:hypothetical protein